jgi:hypothetical protein
MKPKKFIYFFIFLIVIALIYYISTKQKESQLKTTKEGITMEVMMFDQDYNPIKNENPNTYSLLRVNGGQSRQNIKYIKIIDQISSYPSNTYVYVNKLIANDTSGLNLYQQATLGRNQEFSLAPNVLSPTYESQFINISRLENMGQIEFRLSVSGYFTDAYGLNKNVSASNSINILVQPGDCIDGTYNGNCSTQSKGKYCIFGELIYDPFTCSCCDDESIYPCGWVSEHQNELGDSLVVGTIYENEVSPTTKITNGAQVIITCNGITTYYKTPESDYVSLFKYGKCNYGSNIEVIANYNGKWGRTTGTMSIFGVAALSLAVNSPIPLNYSKSGSGVCIKDTCTDGTSAGTCITNSKSTMFPKYCTLNGDTIDGCNSCSTIGTTDACALDHYGGPAAGSCSKLTDPSTCVYNNYTANLVVEVTT